jgi:hypothetical protein
MREHEPIRFESFNGLYNRGVLIDTPMDHFSECNNLKFIGDNSFGTRDGLGLHQSVNVPLQNILRTYNYPTSTKNTLLVLTAAGSIYHVINSTTTYGPLLTIAGMTDFGFLPYGGRAYISPFITEQVGGLNRERGMQNQFVYVYSGDGATPARKAAGAAPTTVAVVANGAAGHTDAGVHIFGYVYETDSGYLTAPGGMVAFTTSALLALNISSIAVSTMTWVTKRHLVASKVIQDFNGDLNGYPLYFVPNGTIANNTGTTLTGISFYDQELLADASHLADNFADIPAGVNLTLYHNRMVVSCTYTEISVGYVSAAGEPEAINQVDGVLLYPPDGNPITNAADLRDILYLFKRNRTGAFVDNGDVPSSWPFTSIDYAMGTGVHGIATVLDSGASNIDYLLVANYKGITMFNGRYILPELTWKIQTTWLAQDLKTKFNVIQMVNDSVSQLLYVMADRTLMYGNYANGFDPKSIRWCPWTFQIYVNSLALVNVSELILGCDQV